MAAYVLRVNGRDPPHRRGARRQPALGPALRPGSDGQQVRLRRRLLRRLHRAHGRAAHAVVHLSALPDSPTSPSPPSKPSPRTAGCIRCRKRFSRPRPFSAATAPWHGHRRDWLARSASESIRRRHRQSPRSQRLPVRHLSADCPRDPTGGRENASAPWLILLPALSGVEGRPSPNATSFPSRRATRSSRSTSIGASSFVCSPRSAAGCIVIASVPAAAQQESGRASGRPRGRGRCRRLDSHR